MHSPIFFTGELRIIERQDWFAKEAEISPITLKTLPPTYVIIIHTMLEHCTTKEKCIDTVRNIQNNHLKHYGDIAFNFLVGGDGSIYVGRGWGVMGNHTYGYDSNSLGIAFIGNYENKRPTNTQIEATINFLDLSVKEQKLSHNYKLLGQRQVAATDSPGDKLFEVITTWKHWNSGGLLFVTRADWKAAEPRRPPEKLDTLPPTYVIIIHTRSQSCSTREACDQSVAFIQTSQMKIENLQDIGYNFLVGGDGSVYVGRGWKAVGEHTIGYNRTSLGIAFIGDFQVESPTDKQLSAAMKLLQFGVMETMLDKEYVVLGQRQAKLTESPGDKLYSIIKNWDHWRKDPVKGELNFVTKAEWGALPTKPSKQFLELPLSYVIIIHTVTPSCMTSTECIKTVRSIQSSQIHEKGLDDIAYNFLIGGDGSVYIGRSWDVEGAHTIDYNATSIGIAFIGDYRVENPTQEQIVVAQKLLEFGVTQKKLTKNYFLLGQNQAMITSSPGDNLYNIIKTWEHWREGPIKGDGPELVTRDEWNAAPPWTPNDNLTTLPPLYVIISHIYIAFWGKDTYCNTKAECISTVYLLQSDSLQYYNDIEHNFLVGGDSLIYEGRGWDKMGEHTYGYNHNSISIAFIGNYELIEPTKEQINATKELLKYGVRKNKLAEKYKLLGQCQLVSYTSSPGTHLYANIQTWEHWSPEP